MMCDTYIFVYMCFNYIFYYLYQCALSCVPSEVLSLRFRFHSAFLTVGRCTVLVDDSVVK